MQADSHLTELQQSFSETKMRLQQLDHSDSPLVDDEILTLGELAKEAVGAGHLEIAFEIHQCRYENVPEKDTLQEQDDERTRIVLEATPVTKAALQTGKRDLALRTTSWQYLHLPNDHPQNDGLLKILAKLQPGINPQIVLEQFQHGFSNRRDDMIANRSLNLVA